MIQTIENTSEKELAGILNTISDTFGFQFFSNSEQDIKRLKERVRLLKVNWPRIDFKHVSGSFEHWAVSEYRIKKPIQLDAFFINQIMKYYQEYLKTQDRPHRLAEIENQPANQYTDQERWFSSGSITILTYGDYIIKTMGDHKVSFHSRQFKICSDFIIRMNLDYLNNYDLNKLQELGKDFLRDTKNDWDISSKENRSIQCGFVLSFFEKLRQNKVSYVDFKNQIFKHDEIYAQKYWDQDHTYWQNRIKDMLSDYLFK